jgi:glycosyltransferase involved in cell wall biosynthesis
MRYLAVVQECFPDRPGGAARVAWDIAKLMVREGHEVSVLCYCPGNQEESSVNHDGIRVVRYRKRARGRWDPRRFQAIVSSAADACHRWLNSSEFDVIHIHSPLEGIGVLSVLSARLRVVYTAHSPLVKEQEINWSGDGFVGRVKLAFGRPLLAAAERRLLRRVDIVHALSAYTCRVLEETYSTADKTIVIPHWAPRRTTGLSRIDARKALRWPVAGRIALTVRRLGPRYGVDVALTALAPILETLDAHFLIAGDGPLRGDLETLAANLGVGDRVRFLGRVSDDELNLAYTAADLFILPTLELECFGLIITEALSLGCPVIATNVAAIPEIVMPLAPQLLVPGGDPLALRDAVSGVLSGAIQVPDSDAIRAYAEDRYGEHIVVPRILDLLRALN